MIKLISLLAIMALPLIAQAQTVVTAKPAPSTGTEKIDRPIEDCACEAQALPEVLAIVDGVQISIGDIEKVTGESVRQLQRQVIEARKSELDLLINSRLLALEATKRGTTTTKLLEEEIVAKVKEPSPIEVRAFYDKNKARIKGDFESNKQEIITYLVEERRQIEARRFADALRAAYQTTVKVTRVVPPRNEAERKQVIAIVNGEHLTAGEIEDSLQPLIRNVQEEVYKLRKSELDLTINDTLLAREAQKKKVTANALLDAELKPKPVTETEAQAFFDENKERISGDFAQTKDSIVKYLQEVELRAAERRFVEKLRAAAAIEIFLTPPE